MSEPTRHYRTCPLCEAVCGLEITRHGDTVTKVQGDKEDVFSRGFVCPKGVSLHRLHEDPDRLRKPLIRCGDDLASATWEEVSWEEAFAEVERRLRPIIEQHGRNAVAVYLGNPNVHNLAGSIYVRPLLKSLGTRNIFSASTVDQMPKEVSSGLMFGNPYAIAVPDLDRTDHLLMLGANPFESNGSLCTAPNFPGRLKALRQRGGRLVVVDPRRTRTAEHADQHVPITPGTDALLLLSMIHVLFEEDLVNLGRLAPWISGIEPLRTACQPFAPEDIARGTGIDPQTTRKLARDLASAERGVVYGRIGTQTTRFGTVAAWAVDVLNALTGNLDEPGGAMWSRPAHGNVRKAGPGRGFRTGRTHSRVKGHPEVVGEYPVATLTDEIETPGDGQVRALLTVAGNPARSTPDSQRLEQALQTLDCIIAVDLYRNETTRHAHVILPPPSPLEKSHYDISFYNLSVRNVAKWSAPVFAHSGPSEADILARLSLIAQGNGTITDEQVIHRSVEDGMLKRAMRQHQDLLDDDLEALRAKLQATEPVDRIVEILVRGGPYGDLFGSKPSGINFVQLQAAQHGIDLGALVPSVPEIIETTSGKIELLPESIATQCGRLAMELTIPAKTGLLLVGRRDLRSNNSWMHNLRPLIKGPDRCNLQMHPKDAAARGLVDGQQVCVSNDTGTVIVATQITDTIMPGVVSLPHGYGHAATGTQQQVAAERPGVNSNALTPRTELDVLSGNAVLTGIPVRVQPHTGTTPASSNRAVH